MVFLATRVDSSYLHVVDYAGAATVSNALNSRMRERSQFMHHFARNAVACRTRLYQHPARGYRYAYGQPDPVSVAAVSGRVD